MATVTVLPATQAQHIIDCIRAWPHWHTIELVARKEYGVTQEEFPALLIEYQRWMGLIALGYTGLGMYSASIDEIWHAHILHTVLYRDFTVQVIGRFVDHLPRLDEDDEDEDLDKICADPETPVPGQKCSPNTPPPECIYEPALSTSSRQRFIHAYFQAYGELPGKMWAVAV